MKVFGQFMGRLMEVGRNNMEFYAGGSAQNSIRVAQWILRRPNATTYFGAVGNDDYGKRLFGMMSDLGVNCLYQIFDDENTGICASLLTPKKRTLVAYIGAARRYCEATLLQPRQLFWIENAQCIHFSGYFVPVNLDAIKYLGEHVLLHDKILSMRLGSGNIQALYSNDFTTILPYIDLLFGSAREALAFGKYQGLAGTTVEEVAMSAASMEKKNPHRPRIVVFTQTALPVIAVENGKLLKFDVPQLYSGEIRDATGAGDAFVGGFLSQYVQGYTIDACVRCGMWAAREVIKHTGCNFAKHKIYGSFTAS